MVNECMPADAHIRRFPTPSCFCRQILFPPSDIFHLFDHSRGHSDVGIRLPAQLQCIQEVCAVPIRSSRCWINARFSCSSAGMYVHLISHLTTRYSLTRANHAMRSSKLRPGLAPPLPFHHSFHRIHKSSECTREYINAHTTQSIKSLTPTLSTSLQPALPPAQAR